MQQVQGQIQAQNVKAKRMYKQKGDALSQYTHTHANNRVYVMYTHS